MGGSARSAMKLFGTLDQPELCAELAVKRICVIAHNLEPTAFPGALRAEGADDDMSAALHGFGHIADVGQALGTFRQEVKDGAVVPNVVRAWFKRGIGDIGDEPLHLMRSFTHTFAADFDGRVRNIENRYVAKTPCDEIRSERRLTTSDVDDIGCPLWKFPLSKWKWHR